MSDPDPNYKGRNLILCFDGTGNYFDDTNTNIVRLFSQLDKTRTDKQLCYYQPGIGTYVSPTVAWSKILSRVSEMIDYAVAWYLDDHIMSGYRYLMDNYTKGDKIIIFGFSRGAYTARCLAGMLHAVGILPKSNQEQVSFAYAIYKSTKTPEGRVQAQGFKQAFSISVDIEFLGVWDTVSSVGLWGRHLPFTYSNTIIRTFRHALSLDERRVKFQPNPWHKQGGERDPEGGTDIEAVKKVVATAGGRFGKTHMPRNKVGDKDEVGDDVYHNDTETDVFEVWFPGAHTDVGGGSEKNDVLNSLANPSLAWMTNEIAEANLGIEWREGAFSDVPTISVIARPSATHGQEATLVSPEAVTNGKKGEHGKLGSEQIVSVRDDLLQTDSKAEIHSPLDSWTSKWWILEYIPLRGHWADDDGKWYSGWTINRGRGRQISGANPNFHISVKMREQHPKGYKPKAKWEGEPVWVGPL